MVIIVLFSCISWCAAYMLCYKIIESPTNLKLKEFPNVWGDENAQTIAILIYCRIGKLCEVFSYAIMRIFAKSHT